MIDVLNVQSYGSESAKVTAVIIQEITVKGNNFDKFKEDLEGVFEKYNTKKG
ncbi:hypothetical protein [Methanococcus maripaludis]|jgi:hypothetical protein|uniref:Uncharacterized protein n=1 Tax=Methanococcus maripaludis TaxID=39152 RepID=A0A8T3VYF7_METMI|nr:hypothetical protein [Methanococcus maripaludis]MBG0769668.1 hypothetical protein [Methanococcus maripaludis]